MSDRIAVMHGGRVEQVATPEQIYEEPGTVFVADFLGVSNLMTATADGHGRLRLGEFELRATRGELSARGRARIVIRPERVRVEPFAADGENRVPGMIERVVYLGSADQLVIRLATGDVLQALVVNDGGSREFAQGAPVRAHLPAEALRVLPDSSQETT